MSVRPRGRELRGASPGGVWSQEGAAGEERAWWGGQEAGRELERVSAVAPSQS